MTREHPDRRVLDRFVGGKLPRRRSLKLAWHLANCAQCRAAVRARPGGSKLLAALFEGVPLHSDPEPLPDYDEVISRTYDHLVSRELSLKVDRCQAPTLLAELERHPLPRRKVLVSNARRFRSWGLAELLLERSWETFSTDPLRSQEHAELALEVADRLEGPAHTVVLLADLEARAWAYLGNARRVVADLAGSEEAFSKAFSLLGSGSGDPLERARLLYLVARLRKDQRRLAEAHGALDRAISVFRRVGDLHLVGSSQMVKATLYNLEGEPERAIALLREAVELIDLNRDHRYYLGARHNLIVYLIEAERFMEAQALLSSSRELYQRFAEPALQRRFQWIRGRVALGLGQEEKAEKFLLHARGDFLAEGSNLEVAEISLELAQIYARQRRSGELKTLAGEMLAYFNALGVHREAMASLLLLLEAAEAERATGALVNEVSRRLRESRERAAGRSRA